MSSLTKAATYYVATNGNDNNPGTQAQPFLSWQKLRTVLQPGDIGYIRGGTYRTTKPIGQGQYPIDWRNLNGTPSAHITVSAFPGEFPVFNMDNIVETVFMIGFYLGNCSYIDFIGLRLTGLKQSTNPVQSLDGWRVDLCNQITFTQCEVDHMQGPGWRIPNTTSVNSVFTFTNCDAHHCGDPLNTGGGVYGNADGFDFNNGTVTAIGCRAWWNSDDGFDCFFSDAKVTFINCWSFWNGYVPGTFTNPGAQADGMGFKWGVGSIAQPNTVLRTYKNCVSFQNKAHGFDQNTAKCIAEFYNCTSYANGLNGYATNYAMGGAPNELNKFRNCISFQDGTATVGNLVSNDHTSNSFDTGPAPTTASFASLTNTGVDGPRASDGSLPVLAFLHLSPTSNQIDKGVNVGLPFSGAAPDYGAFEFGGSANQTPVSHAGADQVITLPTSSVTMAGSGTDPDGTIASFLWTKISGPAATITNSALANTTITGLVQGIYQFQLTVTDNQGATATDVMQVTVNQAPNQLPTANAGADKNITLPTSSVTQVGSGSDPDGTIVSYLWTKISGPASFTIVSASQPTTVINNLSAGIYTFNLRVTDNSGAIANDQFTITVNAANVPPTANAGSNQSITLPTNSVNLSGSGNDPDGSISSFAWTKISGPATFNIVSPSSASTVVNNLVAGTYVFQLTVTDNQGATGSSTVQVLVNPAPPPNQPPTVNAGADRNITLPTNSFTQTGSATDVDGVIANYLWTKVVGPSTFTINSPNASTTTISNLVQGTYVFQLQATDNQGAIGTDQFTVVVNPLPNVPPNVNAGVDQALTLPTTNSVLSGTANDIDGTIASTQWTFISGPGPTPIISTPLSLTSNVSNMTTAGSYQFRLSATDNSGATTVDNMIIVVSPAPNQPPIANAGTDKNITLPTNSVSQVGSGSDADGSIVSYLWTKISGPASFNIVSATQPTTTINNLTQGTYVFNLRVTDNNGANANDQVTIVVNAAVNIPPTANAGSNQAITLPTNSVNLLGSGSDPDGTITGYLWTKISGPATFNIVSPTSAGTVVNNLVAGTYVFQLRVTDNQGAQATNTVQIVVNPAPPPNQPPIANAGTDKNITLPSNSVVQVGSGSDADGTISSYAWTKISGPSTFTIVTPGSSTTPITNLVAGTYIFRLTVTDNQGATGTDDVTIIVNVAPNIPPVVNAGPDQAITLPTSSSQFAGNATDQDGSIVSVTWSFISGPATPVITTPGSLTSTVTGMTLAGSYTFQLSGTDNNGATVTDRMIIVVNPTPNVFPTANAGPDQIDSFPNTTTGTIILNGTASTDPDGAIVSYLWTQISGPSTTTITSATQSVTTVSNLVAGVYVFRLRVTDNNGASSTDNVQATVIENSLPAPPTVNAGPDIKVNLCLFCGTASVFINATATGGAAPITNYQWTKVSGGSFQIVSPNTLTTVIRNLRPGTYVFQITVTNENGDTATDTVQITVRKSWITIFNSKVIIEDFYN